MKKHVFLFASLIVGILITVCCFPDFAVAQSDINAYHGEPIADSLIDGSLGTEWNDAGHYRNVLIYPASIASLWIKQDEANLYIGMIFYADSDNPWVAFQFGSSFCMSTSSDGALFGDDKYSANGYEDIVFTEVPGVSPDAQQDGVGAITVNASSFVSLELKKPLNSGDAAGKDINWTQGNTYTLLIIWDSDGLGSSGGNSSHAEVLTATANTLLITASPVPEFQGFLIFATLVAATISVVVFKATQRAKAKTGLH